MKLLFAGAGITIHRHRDGTYSLLENGYHTAITASHARILARRYGFSL